MNPDHQHLGRQEKHLHLSSMIFHTRFLNFCGFAESKTSLAVCFPASVYLGSEPVITEKKFKSTAQPAMDGSLVCFSLHYLWAQDCSTSAMVFGASRDRINGPPFSWITTSSSILTPSPRKRFGTRSLSSQTYNPMIKKTEANVEHLWKEE